MSASTMAATTARLLSPVALLLCATAAFAAAPQSEVPDATPKGITLQPLGKAQGYGLDKPTASVVPRAEIVFANDHGLTLYQSDADPAGKSVCSDDCAKTWTPALVAPHATPVENWSIITRADGAKQWAYKGKALYTFAEDKDPGGIGGNNPARFYRGEFAGPRGAVSSQVPKDKPLPQGWHAVYFYPAPTIDMPSGFAVKEVADALGLALVDAREHTLYVADASAHVRVCKDACPWVPVAAPVVAENIGDFSPQWREDGIRQWAYKGKLIYTFSGDLVPGDANGVGAEKGFAVARVVKYFAPANITLHDTPKLGKVLADAKGMTLYMRDAYIFQSGSGHSLRRGSPIRPAVGRDLSTNPHCLDDCVAHWHPFLAPADAEPNGNWGVYTRADGQKQWAYQDYALWTFDGDKAPGDINGNDDYQLFMSHDNKTRVDIGTPYDGPTALYWIAAHP